MLLSVLQVMPADGTTESFTQTIQSTILIYLEMGLFMIESFNHLLKHFASTIIHSEIKEVIESLTQSICSNALTPSENFVQAH